jgi:hypothetical protein
VRDRWLQIVADSASVAAMIVAAAAMIYVLLASGCYAEPVGDLRPVVPKGPLAWCFHVKTGQGNLARLCTEYEATCRWAETGAKKYGGLAGLAEIGTCVR